MPHQESYRVAHYDENFQLHHTHPKLSQQDYTPHAHTLLARMDYEYTYIPLFYKFLLYTFIAIGFIWAIIVYYINFPSTLPLNFLRRKTEIKRRVPRARSADTITGPFNASKKEKKKKNAATASEQGRWHLNIYSNWLRIAPHKLKKPIDRPDKYAHLRSNSASTLSPQEPSSISTSASTTPWPASSGSTHAVSASDSTQLKSRRRLPSTPNLHLHLTNHTHPTPASVTPASKTSDQSQTLLVPPLSPPNPFLPPILKTRHSSEWRREHDVFFSSDLPLPNLTYPTESDHRNSRRNSTTGGMSYGDIDAMEAQIPVGRGGGGVGGYMGDIRAKKGRGGVLRASGGWLDMVDGVVDRVVGRVVRWTDGEGEEGLLLPVANG